MGNVQELLDCRIAQWHPAFSHVAFKMVILPLPQHFVDWLVSDGVYVPTESAAVSPAGSSGRGGGGGEGGATAGASQQ